MGYVKVYTDEEQMINRRFFIVFDELGLKVKKFCDKYGYNTTRYYYLKNHIDNCNDSRYSSVTLDAIYNLCKEYEVSLEWLFFGKGNMFL